MTDEERFGYETVQIWHAAWALIDAIFAVDDSLFEAETQALRDTLALIPIDDLEVD
jgi:hypothetical protein